MCEQRYSISLLFNANKAFDRKVLEGIARYCHSTSIDWDFFLEEDFIYRVNELQDWAGDGIIADFDNPELKQAVQSLDLPVVGVGSSVAAPPEVLTTPYVVSDNRTNIELAFSHLKEKGLTQFAFYGSPKSADKKWASERENAYKELLEQEGYEVKLYQGHPTTAETWKYTMLRLTEWVQSLPKPIGIIAVTDSRARQLMQACEHGGLLVPDEVSIIGIDNDELVQKLCKVSLSSVSQGCVAMGERAAKLLHKMIEGKRVEKQILIPPTGVKARQSTDYKSVSDPYVVQAIHFVRQNAHRGIKVEQVADFIGISRSNLEVRYKKERGHSLHTEIHNTKLAQACQKLAETDLPASQVAEESGYPTVQYMHSVFKKHFNSTPKEYRDNAKQQRAG